MHPHGRRAREERSTTCARNKLDVTAEQRERIMACIDLALLDRWLDRAITAASTDEVLAD